MELTEGHKRAIVSMFANGTSIPDLAEWYEVDQATIRAVLRPHVRLGSAPGVRRPKAPRSQDGEKRAGNALTP